VTLQVGDTAVAETTTDTFGDFKFDGLDPSAGTHRVVVSHPQRRTATRGAELQGQSIYLGEIRLGGT